jgi:hypothetical protein
MCNVTSADRLRTHFDLTDFTQMADFTFSIGNTFSNGLFVRNKADKLDPIMFGYPFATDIDQVLTTCAAFIRTNRDLLEVGAVQQKIVRARVIYPRFTHYRAPS